MGIWANSEDPDEMLQNAAFHQVLHYLLKHKLFPCCYFNLLQLNGSFYSYPECMHLKGSYSKSSFR